MSVLRPRALRATAVTTAVSAALLSGLALLPATQAAASAPAAAPGTIGTASEGSAGGLTIENSFVSSRGWVKPGDSYPSRILLDNDGASPVSGATVTITAPRGSSFTDARGAGSHQG